jgi:hypothetical protein
MSRNDDEGGSRRDDPETSKDAARRIRPRIFHGAIFDVLCRYGPPRYPRLSALQIYTYLKEEGSITGMVDSISPRMTEMVESGLVRQFPAEPRPNRSGRLHSQKVYEAVRRS